MPVLHVHLQEGFDGQPVTVSVDGHEVFRNGSIRTRTQIGLAASFDVDVEPGPVALDVNVAGVATRLPLAPTADLYVGLSVGAGGTIVHRTSEEAFGYV